MPTPEGRVKAAVKREMAKWATVYWHCPVQNGMGAPSLDFIGCQLGLYFAVETKALGKNLTPRQEITKKQIEDAGGKVFVIRDECGIENLRLWFTDNLARLGSKF